MQRFTVSSFTEYPFLSHNMTVSINDYLRAPSIDWMKNFVILAKDMGAKKSDIVIADYTLTYQKTIIHGGYNIFQKLTLNTKKSFIILHTKTNRHFINTISIAVKKRG